MNKARKMSIVLLTVMALILSMPMLAFAEEGSSSKDSAGEVTIDSGSGAKDSADINADFLKTAGDGSLDPVEEVVEKEGGNVYSIVMKVGFIVAFLGIASGAFMLINPRTRDMGKEKIGWALVGVGVIAAAVALINLVTGMGGTLFG